METKAAVGYSESFRVRGWLFALMKERNWRQLGKRKDKKDAWYCGTCHSSQPDLITYQVKRRIVGDAPSS